jgi:hypothetical protein
MKPYLISKDVLVRQVYRYSPAYRFAAFLLFCFLAAQVFAAVWIVYERGISAERQSRADQLTAEASRIAAEHRALAETERKLKRIQDLEPILRARLPISAVLGKIEQLAPQDLTIGKVTIDAAVFQPLQIDTSLFSVPREIRIGIEGEQPLQNADPDAYNHFAQRLLESLPPESRIVDSKIVAGQHFKAFQFRLIAPTNGNYFGLGVTQLPTENNSL